MFQSLISFTILAGLLTMLPGLDTAQVLRSVTIGGTKNAYATVADRKSTRLNSSH